MQWVILNGQTLLWKIILAGVPKGSVFFGPLLFLVYMINILEVVTTLRKILADGTSFFSKAINGRHFEIELNKNLKLLS